MQRQIIYLNFRSEIKLNILKHNIFFVSIFHVLYYKKKKKITSRKLHAVRLFSNSIFGLKHDDLKNSFLVLYLFRKNKNMIKNSYF